MNEYPKQPMNRRQKSRSQSGDTIVEVLIAVAVISSVLTGAFLVSQKSALAVRDSQEHGEMLQILQSQVELTRSMAMAEPNPTAGIFANPKKFFCIDGSTAGSPSKVDFPAGFSLPAADADTFAGYPNQCKGIQNLYNVTATYDDAPNVKIFNFYGRWDRIGGGKNQIMLSYRVYPGEKVSGTVSSTVSITTPAGTCAALSTMPGYTFINLWDYNAPDWHVNYNLGSGKPSHPISNTTYPDKPTGPLMKAGTYDFYAYSKDNNYNPKASNLQLYYIGYDASGKEVFRTGDTADLPKTDPDPSTKESPEGEWRGVVTLAKAVHSFKVAHSGAGDPAVSDDSVDSACIGWK